MTLERTFEEATLPANRPVRRWPAVLPLGATLLFLLLGCGGSGHGTMMAHQPDGGGVAGNPGGGGAGGARVDAGADATVSDGRADATSDGGANDSPIKISVTVDRCPSVLAAASPSKSTLDEAIAVDATADDADGDALTYLWSATAGTFAAPTAASTTYTCATAGDVMLTVTVSDRKCEGQAVVPFTCLATP